MGAARQNSINLSLHARQGMAFTTKATEVLYGGAAGGGKSHLMRVAATAWCLDVPGLQIYLFRRLFDDLHKNHMEGPTGFRAMLQPLVEARMVEIVQEEIRFSNGSKIYLCHCQHETDRFKYLGVEMHVLMMDELTSFTEDIYRFLRSRVRMTGIHVPPRYEGMFPRILCGSNPGGVGHHFVKNMWIDEHSPMEIWRAPKEEGGMLRMFVPAKLSDNPTLAEQDPGYEDKLSGLGSPEYVRQLKDGDWTVVSGSFFSEFGPQHILEPFTIPAHWMRIAGFDWGSFRPYCCLWGAVSDGNTPDGVPYIPAGAVVIYKELYGSKGPNRGLKHTAIEVRKRIMNMEAGDIPTVRMADPSIFKHDGGPSNAELLLDRDPITQAVRGVAFLPADNQRPSGWQNLRNRLVGEEKPMLYMFKTCYNLIRTLPALQHDDHRPEDVDTTGEDHAPDALRYLLSGRPYIVNTKHVEPQRTIYQASLEEMWRNHEEFQERNQHRL